MMNGFELLKVLSKKDICELVILTKEATNNNASIGFLYDSTDMQYLDYWNSVANSLCENHFIFVKKENDKIIATVQLIKSTKINGNHRGEIAKLLVSSEYQNRGLARGLMRHVEDYARNIKLNLLVLDTQEGSSAEKFYIKDNWTLSGVIPNYARSPDGIMKSTSTFYKQL